MVVTGLSGFGLAKVFIITKPKIAEQKKMAEESAKKVIFSTADTFEKKKVGDVEYEIALKDGKKLGILFKAAKSGYSSTIVTLVGLDNNDKIIGTVILDQQETPGLGARMEEIKSDKYIWTFWKKDEKETESRPWFQEMYVGTNPAKLNLVKGTEWKDLDENKKRELQENSTITALSGATISTRANMLSIKEAYAKLKKALKSKTKSEEKGTAVNTVTTVLDSVKIDSTFNGSEK